MHTRKRAVSPFEMDHIVILSMPTFDELVDQWVNGLVQGIAFLIRFVILILPVMLAGPFIDFITCWRYMITASGLQYIWLGRIISTASELRYSPHNVTDGSFCFDLCDFVFQCIYGLPLGLILAVTVVIDVFTCNQVKITSRLVPQLVQPILGVRRGLSALANRPIVWGMDSFWKDCCFSCGFRIGQQQQQPVWIEHGVVVAVEGVPV